MNHDPISNLKSKTNPTEALVSSFEATMVLIPGVLSIQFHLVLFWYKLCPVRTATTITASNFFQITRKAITSPIFCKQWRAINDLGTQGNLFIRRKYASINFRTS